MTQTPGKLGRLPNLRPPSWLREFFIFAAFLLITALMTWPWARYLNDAVADNGDSYAFVWSLWWNFHQTFHHPLHLFDGNIFFPYRYTLAFTEHGYGVAILFFPLFALGLRPVTVYSIATFVAFATSGYGAFRLARTLSGSYGASWTAGVIFAFVPYHFLFVTALPYLWTAWIPLLLEALALFARVRSWRRAIWLGITFLLTGLTCVNWFFLALVPLVLSVGVIAVRLGVARERAFWTRGILALGAASLLLLPFLWPYYKASQIYGFRRDVDEVTQNSASLADWLFVPAYNKVWDGLGRGLPGAKATLFPGLIPLLLVLAAVVLVKKRRTRETSASEHEVSRRNLLYKFDAVSIIAGCVALVAAGFSYPLTADLALLLLSIAFVVRACLQYPHFLRCERNSLIESLRLSERSDAFWIAATWAVFGFLCSFGMSTFLYRSLYNFVTPFQSVRGPSRAAMICYVGLSVLAGLGAARLAQVIQDWRPSFKSWMVCSIIVAALLYELHATPMPLIHGAAYPDAVTQRLKEMSMRGGIVELPSMPQPPFYSWHLSMLRAADHAHPVVFAAASFTPYLTIKVHEMSSGPTIPKEFLDLLEEIPASYVIMRWQLATPERRLVLQQFLSEARASGRLKLVGIYDKDELYVVTKTEPETR